MWGRRGGTEKGIRREQAKPESLESVKMRALRQDERATLWHTDRGRQYWQWSCSHINTPSKGKRK